MASFPDLSAPLTGSVARLRPTAERDIPEMLIAHQDDPGMHVWIGLDRPPSGAELGRRIDAEPDARLTGTGVLLTIVTLGSDECGGAIEIRDVDWEHRRAELAVWVAPAQRGRGLATDALCLSARWLIGACGLERVQLLADPENAALRRAARGAGFVEEGTLRRYRRRDGRRVDVVMIALVAADLEAAA